MPILSVRNLKDLIQKGQVPSTTRVGGRLLSDTDGSWSLRSDDQSLNVFALEGEWKSGDWVTAQALWDDTSKKLELWNIELGTRPLAPDFSKTREFSFGFLRAQKVNQILNQIRKFFEERDFIEAQTPTLVPSPGLEVHLDPFSTEFHLGSSKKTLFLPTSPEFHLKKLLSRGWLRIFEIKDCFRNGELSPHHQAEFKMLEWYRAFKTLDDIEKDVLNLIRELSKEKLPEVRRRSIRQLFREYAELDLRPDTPRETLMEWLKARKLDLKKDDTWNELYFRIFLHAIEPRLGEGNYLDFICDFPPSQAALAEIGPEGWARRFEVYWRGLELGNAYQELTDAREQRLRFQVDLEEKARLGKPLIPVDEEFMRALESGIPPCAGIAMGVDRLLMAVLDVRSIGDLRAFPLKS